MTKKKKPRPAANKKTPGRKGGQAKLLAREGLPATKFTEDFRDFLTKPNPQKDEPRLWDWPPAQPLKLSLASVAAVVGVLGDALGKGAPPIPGNSGNFIDQAAARIAKFNWPTGTDYLKDFKSPVAEIQLYEIELIVDLMLEAIWKKGGGGPSRWPPSK